METIGYMSRCGASSCGNVRHGCNARLWDVPLDCSESMNVGCASGSLHRNQSMFMVHEQRMKAESVSQQPLSLRPHDVCVLLQLVLTPEVTFRKLAELVGISLGEAHNATKRLEVSRLYVLHLHQANRPALTEFLISGVPYAFPGELGPETRGVPTAHSGPALAELVSTPHVVVWPSPHGEARGLALTPLCAAAPKMINSNPLLYRWLTVVDALRVGRARERSIARSLIETELASTLHPYG